MSRIGYRLFIFLVLLASTVTFARPVIGSRTIIVPINYPTISEALNFANDGDTIYVLNGTYKEDYVQVDKSVRLIGENRNATVIQGSVSLVGNNIELKHFNITKVFQPYTGGFAVSLYRSSNILIEDNIIQSNSIGIYFQTDPGPAPQNITILRNDVLWYNVSWDLAICYGIYVGPLIGNDYSRTSRGLKIINNRIEGWASWAIAGFLSGKNEFISNTLLNNRWGMGFGFGDKGNVLCGNIINGTENCFSIWSRSLEGYLQNIDTSNLINGKPIYYLLNQSNTEIDYGTCPNIGFLGVINSQNITVQKLDFSADFLLAYVADATLKDLKLSQNIELFECGNCEISRCLFSGGLYIGQSNRISIQRNDIFNSSLALGRSESCTIEGNNIQNGYGLGGWDSSSTCVIGNRLVDNMIGIDLSECTNFTISENDISRNGIGLHLDNSNGNCIYLNNIIDNTQQLELIYGSFANTWDNGREGNYWSDYNGTDINRDGIGDTYIPHQKVDWLPLMGIINFLNITHGEKSYEINTISNCTITSCWLDETLKTLNLRARGTSNGFCRIILPNEIGLEILARNYKTLVNGNEPFYARNWTSKEYTYIYLEYENIRVKDFPETHRDNTECYLILPACTGKDPTVGLPVWNASVSDWTAAGFVGGILQHEEVRYDTDPEIINQTTGEPTLTSGSGLVLFGGPRVDQPVYYYEVDKTAAVIYCGVPGAAGPDEPWSQWYHNDGKAITETAIGTTEHLDLFLIELFCDHQGRYILIVYGVGWKGSLAGGIYFDHVIYPDIGNYTNSWYIFKWEDDGDGNVEDPTQDTYVLLATGN